ncbi:MAG: ketopantoate reductase family protein [bacterium]|nr:ketopantoate reductase family protein [bacterium]
MEINNVIIFGLGAIGVVIANKLKDICNLKILVDEKRLNKFKTSPPMLNNVVLNLDYITPENNFDADLVIIATKSSGLKDAIKSIKNFIGKNTIIISLINGITSEKEIAEIYGKEKVINSFYIGHSAMREGNSVVQDGVWKIVFGPNSYNKEKAESLKQFLEQANINFEFSKDIIYPQWVKFGVNICLNQISAVYGVTVGEVRNKYFNLMEKLIDEVVIIAQKIGLDTINLKRDIINVANEIADDGKTSMLQDILAKRKTEIDIFAGEIIKLGNKYDIVTPQNAMIYEQIKRIESQFEGAIDNNIKEGV